MINILCEKSILLITNTFVILRLLGCLIRNRHLSILPSFIFNYFRTFKLNSRYKFILNISNRYNLITHHINYYFCMNFVRKISICWITIKLYNNEFCNCNFYIHSPIFLKVWKVQIFNQSESTSKNWLRDQYFSQNEFIMYEEYLRIV